MLGRRPRRPSPSETASPDDGTVTLAVYHRGDDVEQHVAPLRPAGGLRLEFVRKGTLWTIPNDVAGVLWELTPDDGAHRLVAALVANVPAASYSATAQPGLEELSRALGFREHLIAPLRLADVERALGLRDAIDLADRIEVGGPRVVQLASHPDTIGAVVRSVNVSLEPADVASALIARAAEWLPLAAWHVIAVEPDGSLRPLGDPAPEAGLKAAVESFADVVIKTGQSAFRVTNYIDDRVSGASRESASVEASEIGWPLIANGSVIGALIGVDVGRARRLPAMTEGLADALARLVEPAAYALANSVRVARAEALSVTDDLTQLYNSRFLNDALRKESKRAMRSGWPLSLLFIDLDGFKKINDAYGHLLGSRALIDAAGIIKSCSRETDIVARFGGDEFAILLPETGSEGAQMVARRLRDRMARHVFLADSSSGNRVTASIGVATMPDAADTAERLLQAADAAMYRVKVTGKNGIHVAGSETESTPAQDTDEETIR
jgi:diguanylate cyclase (GGDEF)-like protein